MSLEMTSSDALNEPQSPEATAFRAASTDRALQRIVARGLDVSSVIDVGASNGMWSAVAMKYYPRARYCLIEAQKVHEPALREFCRTHTNAEFVLRAAGDTPGEIYFDECDPFGGVASKTPTQWATSILPVTTIDAEVEARQLVPPYLVKLDTHGFEIPIFEGARTVLEQTNLIVVEVYNFRISTESLLFFEMCAFLKQKGFNVIDISEPMWRKYDGSFWQMDLFFIPSDRPEFSYNSYE
jgi:FkbM family methyltransferase